MKTLIIKELRETLWLAVLGVLVFCALLGSQYVIYRDAMARVIAGESEHLYILQPLIADAPRYSSFFCAIFAAVLGFLQIFKERHRNVWAFLLHRPATPTTIFLGKIVAGSAIYLIVTGLPLLVFILWARLGNIAAPFDWRMILPVGSALVLGLAYYLAGLLTGARGARWYTTRGLGFGVAIVLTACALGAESLWELAAVLVASLAVLAVSAWASFCNSGYDEGQPPAGKPALAVALACGWSVILFFAALIVADGVERLLPASPWSYYAVSRDGSIYQVTRGENQASRITDLEGNPARNRATAELLTISDLQSERADGFSLEAQETRHRRKHWLERSWGRFNFWAASSGKIWYLLDPERRLAGYDTLSRQFIGTLGPEGFSTNWTGSGEGFTLRGARTLGTSTALYTIEPSRGTTTRIFSTPSDEPIVCAQDIMAGGQRWEHTLVATPKAVTLITPEGKPLWKVDYTSAYPNFQRLRGYALDPPGSFILWNDAPEEQTNNGGKPAPASVTWIKDGRITETALVPPAHSSPQQPEVQDHLVAGMLSPLMVGLAPSFLSLDWSSFWSHLLRVSVAVALVCVPVGWIFARRRNESPAGALAWCLFILVFGLPGLLTLLSIAEKPLPETPPAHPRAIEIFEATTTPLP